MLSCLRLPLSLPLASILRALRETIQTEVRPCRISKVTREDALQIVRNISDWPNGLHPTRFNTSSLSAAMADNEDPKKHFETTLKGAILDVHLPMGKRFDAAETFKNGSLEQLRNAPTRRNLFFDEHVEVFVVLKASASQDGVQQLLPSLEIVLAAHATDAVPQGTGNAASTAGKHDIASKTISADHENEILSVGDNTFLVWKLSLHLTRPRVRLQRPAIYFTVNLTVKALSLRANRNVEEDFLQPYEPLPANVLAPLNRVPEFEGKNIYLSADRITKVAPKPVKKEENVKPIRGASKRAFPTMPALFTRMRFSQLPDQLIASLHVEASHVIAGSFSINRLSVEIPDPDAPFRAIAAVDQAARESKEAPSPSAFPDRKSLRPMTDVPMPLTMHAGDEHILLYKLDTQGSTKVSVALRAEIALEQGVKTKLDIKWQAKVDLGTDQPPETTYKWSRPSNGRPSHQAKLSASSAQNPPASQGDSAPQSTAVDSSVTFFFEAPATAYQDNDFTLKVKCINSSSRPRRFTVVPVHRTMTTHQLPSPDKANASLIANTFKASPLPTPLNVTVLTPDVRIGPLPSGACFETQIALRAIGTGILDLGPLRIIDLDSKHTVNVRDLPDVVALEAEEGREPYRLSGSKEGAATDGRWLAWREKEEARLRREIEMEGKGQEEGNEGGAQ